MAETVRGTSRSEYATQGKSNNFVAAQASGRLTAGQAAKRLRKRLGRKILAREIEPLAEVEQAAAPLWGWVLGFRAEYTGPYGKKRHVPIVAEVGQFAADKANRLGDKFHELSETEAVEAKAAVGKRLPAYSTDWRAAE